MRHSKSYDIIIYAEISKSSKSNEIVFKRNNKVYFIDSKEQQLYDKLSLKDIGRYIPIWVLSEKETYGYVSIALGNETDTPNRPISISEYIFSLATLDYSTLFKDNLTGLHDGKLIKLLHKHDDIFRKHYENDAIILTGDRKKAMLEYKNNSNNYTGDIIPLTISAHEYILTKYIGYIDITLPNNILSIIDKTDINKLSPIHKDICNIITSSATYSSMVPRIVYNYGRIEAMKFVKYITESNL